MSQVDGFKEVGKERNISFEEVTLQFEAIASVDHCMIDQKYTQ